MAYLNDTPSLLSHQHSAPALTCSKPASTSLPVGANHDLVPNFQRNFCSNFVCICCYVRLPSLHDLYDHVEEAHIGPNGLNSWPPKVFSELSINSDHPPRPSSPSKDPDSDYAPDDSILAIAYSTSETYNDFSSSSSYEDTFHLDYFTTCDAENLSSRWPPIRYPVARYERFGSCLPIATPSASSEASEVSEQDERDDESEADSEEVQKQDDKSSVDQVRSRLRRRTRRIQMASSLRQNKTRLGSKPNLMEDTLHKRGNNKRRSSKKDLFYNCPTPGCTKTYRNANGLKYHKEKGTCTISEKLLTMDQSPSEDRCSIVVPTSDSDSGYEETTPLPPQATTSSTSIPEFLFATSTRTKPSPYHRTGTSRPPMDCLIPPPSNMAVTRSPSPFTPEEMSRDSSCEDDISYESSSSSLGY
ncbi:hypothetical protein EV360DRAFT_80410 [Lentinula raphanica]|nr:hypothetical protein EV360DRAFT_80410 [Lentinula raphanica]